jgi:hypothetical protein
LRTPLLPPPVPAPLTAVHSPWARGLPRLTIAAALPQHAPDGGDAVLSRVARDFDVLFRMFYKELHEHDELQVRNCYWVAVPRQLYAQRLNNRWPIARRD